MTSPAPGFGFGGSALAGLCSRPLLGLPLASALASAPAFAFALGLAFALGFAFAFAFPLATAAAGLLALGGI